MRLIGLAALFASMLGLCLFAVLDLVLDAPFPLGLWSMLDVASSAAFTGSLLALPLIVLALLRLPGANEVRQRGLSADQSQMDPPVKPGDDGEKGGNDGWRAFVALWLFAVAISFWCIWIYSVAPHYPINARSMKAYRVGVWALLPLAMLLSKPLAKRFSARSYQLALAGSLPTLIFVVDDLIAGHVLGKMIYFVHIAALGLLWLSLFLFFALSLSTSDRAVLRRASFVGGGTLLGLALLFLVRWETSFAARDHIIRGSDLMMPFNEAPRLLRGDLLSTLRAAPAKERQQKQESNATELLSKIVETRPKNVLLISIDSLRANTLQDPTLRALSRLQREGVSLSEYRVTSPGTLESFTALFYGAHRAQANDLTSVAEVFSANGFFTLGITATLNIKDSPTLNKGFAVFDGSLGQRSYEANTADLITDKLLAHLSNVEMPFFVWAHYYEPHIPYDAPGETVKERYDEEVRRVDREIDRLLNTLEARGTLSQTLVVLVGDHGEEFFEHGGQSHARTLYEEVLRVPCLIRAPGGKLSGELPLTASGVDLAKTLLTMMRIESPAGFAPQGQSLFMAEPSRPIFATRGVPWRQLSSRVGTWEAAVYEANYKLIVNLEYGSASLYDLDKDPSERNNLIDKERGIASRLTSLLVPLLEK